MYPATIVAYAFVKKGISDGAPVTQMKLQKLVYFAHGLFLAANKGLPLIKENFEAWKFGPVVPSLYQEYKLYGSSPILNTDKAFYIQNPTKEQLDDSAKIMIDETWDILKGIDPIRLSNWTHEKGSPWDNHYKEEGKNEIIPNKEIEAYFKRFIKEDGAV